MIGQTEFKISQFADDATCFVRTQESADAVLETLKSFESFSGLRINVQKSVSLHLGPSQATPTLVAGLKCVDKAKILGIWCGNTKTPGEHYDWNFKLQIGNMRAI